MDQSSFFSRYKYNLRTDLLGSGGFGKVYKAYDDVRDRIVAIKIAEVNSDYEQNSLYTEVKLSKSLPPHKNIAYYEDCYRYEMSNGIFDFGILQFYPDGNLSDVIKKETLSEYQKINIAIGIIYGLKFLHQHNIVHRDLKSSNILITKKDSEFIPKITDFGLSKNVENINSTFKTNSFVGGSIKYSAPEQLLNTKTKGNVDIWSLGVILFEIFVGKVPFEIGKEGVSTDYLRIDSIKRITDGQIPETISLCPEPFKSIIFKCLIVDPDFRLQSVNDVIIILSGKETNIAPDLVRIQDTNENTFIVRSINKPINTAPESLDLLNDNAKESVKVKSRLTQKIDSKKYTAILLSFKKDVFKAFGSLHSLLKEYLVTIKSSLSKVELSPILSFYKSRKLTIWISFFIATLFGSAVYVFSTMPNYHLKPSNSKFTIWNDDNVRISNLYVDSITSDWFKLLAYSNDTIFDLNKNGKVLSFKLMSLKSTSDEANRKDNLRDGKIEYDWKNTLFKNNIQEYEKFIATYPDSKYKNFATKSIDSILDATINDNESSLWKYAESSKSITAYRLYLDKFPLGKNEKIATERIKNIEFQNELQFWKSIENTIDVNLLLQYTNRYPKGKFIAVANDRIINLKKTALTEKRDSKIQESSINQVIEKPSETIQTQDEKAVEIEIPSLIRKLEENFVKIPGGSFYLGCEGSDCPKDAKGGSRTQVRSFYMSKYEVTQEFYAEVMGKNPSEFNRCGKCPVESISYQDIGNFIKKLNSIQGNKYEYRLPTESEWEFAALANENKEFSGSNDLEEVGASKMSDFSWSIVVGSKRPNKFGLFDMSGNVYEFCQSIYSPQGYGKSPNGKIVIRGGSWNSNSEKCKIKTRSSVSPSEKSPAIGFRLVRD